ncbi:MAG: glycosyltransferase family 61 protein [Hymenobacter sp.]|nr:MAG: glycosyltransferase family 61 protein [Hymenobacter sp.]
MISLIKNFSNITLAKVSKSLPAWTEDKAIQVVPSLRAQHYRLPVNIEDLPSDLAAHYVALATGAPYKLPSVSIYIIDDANVSFVGAPFKNLQLFRPDMSPYTEEYFRNNYLLMQWLVPKQRLKKIKEAALVHDIWAGQNYYHWLVESMPRLLMLRKFFPNIDIILPTPTPAYISETLALLNFTKFIPIANGEFFKVKKLIVPQKLPFIDLQLEDAIKEKHEFGLQVVRASLLNAFPEIVDKIPHRLVYVSRAKQSMRRVSNEQEVLPILKKLNFEIFYFEELTFEQQVILMQETAILIGLHGANLTNLMFMNPNTKVVELMNIDSTRLLFYFFMSSYFSLEYYCMPCNSVDAITTNHSDVFLNVEAFEHLLISIVGK